MTGPSVLAFEAPLPMALALFGPPSKMADHVVIEATAEGLDMTFVSQDHTALVSTSVSAKACSDYSLEGAEPAEDGSVKAQFAVPADKLADFAKKAKKLDAGATVRVVMDSGTVRLACGRLRATARMVGWTPTTLPAKPDPAKLAMKACITIDSGTLKAASEVVRELGACTTLQMKVADGEACLATWASAGEDVVEESSYVFPEVTAPDGKGLAEDCRTLFNADLFSDIIGSVLPGTVRFLLGQDVPFAVVSEQPGFRFLALLAPVVERDD